MNQAVLVSHEANSEIPDQGLKQQAISLLELSKNQPAVIETIIENPRFASLDNTVTQRLKDRKISYVPMGLRSSNMKAIMARR